MVFCQSLCGCFAVSLFLFSLEADLMMPLFFTCLLISSLSPSPALLNIFLIKPQSINSPHQKRGLVVVMLLFFICVSTYFLAFLPLPASLNIFLLQPQPSDSLLQENDGWGVVAGGVLDLELCGLRFMHHHLFSPEHVLAAQLTRDYALYRERVSLGATRIQQAKLAVS